MEQDLKKKKNNLQKLNFEDYANEMKEKILSDKTINDLSQQYFKDCFEYVMKLYKSNKPLDINLLKIYLEQVKNYKNIKFDEFVRIIILLGFCGFSFNFDKNNIKNNK